MYASSPVDLSTARKPAELSPALSAYALICDI